MSPGGLSGVPSDGPIELWAGVECTVNRVRDLWLDQVDRTGHHTREGDIDRLAAMGVKAVRYPVLWERTAPGRLEDADWTFADARLTQLHELGMRPIVGLVHHGSGPSHTSLVDEEFPAKLAAYARAVAQRFPWVRDWTPVNEPLTTARFAGLYGLWHPHGRDASVFLRALVVECRAVLLAMRAIREVIPEARLVQTEDVATVWSTERMAYQAEFENHRRWLGFDLLTGRVTRRHRLWRYLTSSGITTRELDALATEGAPPDLLGLNYYVTSDRFLDERLERYPAHAHGRNESEQYADIEAVRVRGEGIQGHAGHLQAAWRRYGIPVALTEVHLGCTREEQLRWVLAAWEGAREARARGADVRAVTVWSAFGAIDWDSLLVRADGHYEPGAYDLRAPEPRPTALVSLARELADTGRGTHPVLRSPGWWATERRLSYPMVGQRREDAGPSSGPPLLIIGASTALGRAVTEACVRRGLPHRTLWRPELDAPSVAAALHLIAEAQPWAVVNAAGFLDVDAAEDNRDRCERENAWGVLAIAGKCRHAAAALMTFSTDLVFDGRLSRPYTESDAVGPLGAFGASKQRGEGLVQGALPEALVIRHGPLFGPTHHRGFAARLLSVAKPETSVLAPTDVTVSPTYAPDLVDAALDLLIDGERGVWHLATLGELTWAAFGERLQSQSRSVAPRMRPVLVSEVRGRARLPAMSALISERARIMPPLEDAIARYIGARSVARNTGAADAAVR